MDNPGKFSINTKMTHVCPVCGYEVGDYDGLRVSGEPFSGVYCINCWAKWIHENIPKMEKIEGRE